MSESLKNKYNRVGTDKVQLQEFVDKVCDGTISSELSPERVVEIVNEGLNDGDFTNEINTIVYNSIESGKYNTPLDLYLVKHNHLLQGGLYFETGSAYIIYASQLTWSDILSAINDLLISMSLITERFENYGAFKIWFDALPIANKKTLALQFVSSTAISSIATNEIKLYITDVDVMENVIAVDAENNNVYYIDISTGTTTDINTLIAGTTRLLFNDSEISQIGE